MHGGLTDILRGEVCVAWDGPAIVWLASADAGAPSGIRSSTQQQRQVVSSGGNVLHDRLRLLLFGATLKFISVAFPGDVEPLCAAWRSTR